MKLLRKTGILCLACMLAVASAFMSYAAPVYGPGMKTHFDGEEMVILKNQTSSQMMSYVIRTKNGALIVVDGGLPADAQHLKETLLQFGGHVNAWFITHPHSDHAGAFAQLVEDGLAAQGLSVDMVYYHFADQEWYVQNEDWRAETAARVRAAVESLGPDSSHVTHKDEVYTIDSVTVRVMNDPYLLSENSINNSSVCFQMTVGQQKVLFLGDLGAAASGIFLADHAPGDVKSDFVQMAHHGQHGVTREVYEAIAPSVCMWNAPYWLYDNDTGNGPGSGPYGTLEVRKWMEELGVLENYCIKDGDQRIR